MYQPGFYHLHLGFPSIYPHREDFFRQVKSLVISGAVSPKSRLFIIYIFYVNIINANAALALNTIAKKYLKLKQKIYIKYHFGMPLSAWL